jgi:hypothetical protein
MSVKAAMNNVSLAVSVSDEIPLFPEEANAPAPMGHGFPIQSHRNLLCHPSVSALRRLRQVRRSARLKALKEVKSFDAC